MKNEKSNDQNVKFKTMFLMSYVRMQLLKFAKKKVRVSFLSFFKTRMNCFSLDLSIIAIMIFYFTAENFSFLYSIIVQNSFLRDFFIF